jgi:GT2 family glycosyltransferase
VTRNTGAVYAFTPTRGDYHYSFGAAKWQLEKFDDRSYQRFSKPGGGWIIEPAAADHLAEARNRHFESFLKSGAEWFLQVDDDLTCWPDAVEQLIAAADPVERPIIGALCFRTKEAGYADGMATRNKVEPTILRHLNSESFWGFVPVFDYPPDTVVRCAATGTGFLLVHRSAAEKIAERATAPFTRLPNPIEPTNLIGEDLSFCIVANAQDIPVHVHTGVRTSHMKTWAVDENEYVRQRHSFSTGLNPITVVVPVLNRSGLTRQVLEDLSAQYVDRVFVYDNGSTDDTVEVVTEAAKAFPEGVVELIDATGWGFHKMWNDGIDRSLAYHPASAIAFLNNDLRIGKKALQEMRAQLVADERLAAVSANYDKRQWWGQVQRTQGICAGRYDGTGGLAGFAFMVKGHLYATGQLPKFDEQFQLWYGDTDFVMELDTRGWWYGIVLRAEVEHVGGGSQSSGQRKDLDKVVAADKVAFEAKWGGR